MGKLKNLVIHCTATAEGRVVTVDDIFKWHTEEPPIGSGWSRVGYSDLVDLEGRLINLRGFDQDDEVDPWEITNGVKGLNGVSRHIVYVGGLAKDARNPKDTRTIAQRNALRTYVEYMILRHPDIKVLGHNQADAKACPSFNVPEWLRAICVPEQNIYEGS